MKKIQVGFLLSYDYEKLKISIPFVYKEADEIFLAKDENNLTWSGNPFSIDPSFYEWLDTMDVANKITIYEDNFYVPELDALQNDTRERKMLAAKMGIGNWLIQVDSDEYFVDFPSFIEQIRKYNHYLDNPEKRKIQIATYQINLYKYVEEGVFYVKNPTRFIIATNYPDYKGARNTKARKVYTSNLLLHECLSRDEASLQFKLDNWGHKGDLKASNDFMKKWRDTNLSNYKEKKNLFYLNPERWKSLDYIEGKTIEEIIENVKGKNLAPSKFLCFLKTAAQYLNFLFK